MRSGIFGYQVYSRVFPGISGYIGYHLFFGGSEPDIEVFFFHLLRVFFKGAANHYLRLSWCSEMSCFGIPEISGNFEFSQNIR